MVLIDRGYRTLSTEHRVAGVCVAGHQCVWYHVSNQGSDGDGLDSSLLSLVNYDHFNTCNDEYTGPASRRKDQFQRSVFII